MSIFSLNKSFRLVFSHQFKLVYQRNKKIITPYFIILGRINLLNFSRLGLCVTKKNIKYSHERNRIKRLIRENFRILKHKLIHMDYVVIVKKKVRILNNKEIFYLLKNLWFYKVL